jgi:hypothetical protein
MTERFLDYRDYLDSVFFEQNLIDLMANPVFQDGLAKILSACDDHKITPTSADFIEAIRLMRWHGF